MKKSRIFIFCAAAAMALTGCGNRTGPVTELSGTVSSYETETSSAVAKAETKETKPKKKAIKPLPQSSNKAYFQNDDFSLTVMLTDLKSSLYYPDIVHDFGANPDLFVLTVLTEVKNMTYENKAFDASKLSIPDMFCCGGDTEALSDIKSGRSEIGKLRFLCSLEQAAAISGVVCDGEYLEEGEDFYPKEFKDIIDIQSADDVSEYLYRQHYIHGRQSGYFWLNTEPTTCELHHIKAVEKDGKNYLSVSYTCYNRSDYAQLIEPSAYVVMCGRNTEKAEDIHELTHIEPLYISVDEKLVYEPQEVGLELNGTLYEIPEYICMTPENPTEFTLIYDFKDLSTVIGLYFKSSHKDEPYYSKLSEYGYGFFDWNAWEEDFIDS